MFYAEAYKFCRSRDGFSFRDSSWSSDKVLKIYHRKRAVSVEDLANDLFNILEAKCGDSLKLTNKELIGYMYDEIPAVMSNEFVYLQTDYYTAPFCVTMNDTMCNFWEVVQDCSGKVIKESKDLKQFLPKED